MNGGPGRARLRRICHATVLVMAVLVGLRCCGRDTGNTTHFVDVRFSPHIGQVVVSPAPWKELYLKMIEAWPVSAVVDHSGSLSP